jgi:ABC-type multidrug transport system fused ATPase/permease subunit
MHVAFTSLLQTVGYGDLSVGEDTRVFLCVYIFVSTIMVAYAISMLTSLIKEELRARSRKRMLERKMDLQFLTQLNDGQGITKLQFLIEVLEHLKVVRRERDIDPWLAVSAFMIAQFPLYIFNSFIHGCSLVIYFFLFSLSFSLSLFFSFFFFFPFLRIFIVYRSSMKWTRQKVEYYPKRSHHY